MVSGSERTLKLAVDRNRQSNCAATYAQGFGGRIIEQMIAQLIGESRFDWRAERLTCEIALRV